MKRWIKANPLVPFFLLAFLISWVGWVPVAVLSQRNPSFQLPNTVLALAPFAFGPTLAGVLLTSLTEGKAGVRALLRRVIAWRIGLRWYLVALLLPAVILLGGLWLESLVSPTQVDWTAAQIYGVPTGGISPWLLLPLLLPVIMLVGLIGGPLNEEVGWRGFALPRLQERLCPATSSLILGILWGLWHLPLFWITGMIQASMALTPFLVGVVINTFLFTWVHNHTGGSIFAAVLLHSAINGWPVYLPINLSSWWGTVVSAILVVAVMVVEGKRWLTLPRNRPRSAEQSA